MNFVSTTKTGVTSGFYVEIAFVRSCVRVYFDYHSKE